MPTGPTPGSSSGTSGMDAMNVPVRYDVVDRVAVVTIDHPPVNAMNQAVRAGLLAAITELGARADHDAVVIACAGRTFVAGADIKEFDTGIGEPGYHDVYRAIEDHVRPVVAAVHGTALGAGTELALACHYRVADEHARLGLPELTLGIIPGAGGTQRLPRLVPLAAALDLMLSTKPLPAAEARASGLVDAIVPAGDVVAGAVAFARDRVRDGHGPRRTRELPVRAGDDAAQVLAAARARVAKTMRHRVAPVALVDTVEAALALPFDQGLQRESEVSADLVDAPEARASRHLFFAEREARRVPGLPAGIEPRPVATVGVVGAGTMGGGIAMGFANAGMTVTIVDATRDKLDAGLATVRRNYERSVARGSLSAAEMEARLLRITPALDLGALSAADLVIEAVYENMALKRDVFERLDDVARPGAILATNTSTLDVDAIAASTRRPQDVIGLHFFSPAHVMPLLEVVRGRATAPDVLATALKVAQAIRKTAVVAKVAYGFIGNRMMDPYGREAERCLLEGATPVEVDSALEDFGMAMGILAVYDLAGTDVGHLTRLERAPLSGDDPAFYRCSALLNERGWLGQKSGRGFYRYENGKRVSDPEATAMFHAEGARLGIERRPPSAEEIVERCVFALVNEGARVLEEGVALRASDIDVVYTAGYGFPRHRGGPMFHADTVGLDVIHQRILDFRARFGPRYWEPSPLLAELARAGSNFGAWTP